MDGCRDFFSQGDSSEYGQGFEAPSAEDAVRFFSQPPLGTAAQLGTLDLNAAASLGGVGGQPGSFTRMLRDGDGEVFGYPLPARSGRSGVAPFQAPRPVEEGERSTRGGGGRVQGRGTRGKGRGTRGKATATGSVSIPGFGDGGRARLASLRWRAPTLEASVGDVEDEEEEGKYDLATGVRISFPYL